MDELDRNLLEAWGRVVERLRSDAGEARKRWRRSRGKVLRRPIRAWCLALRASDTRFVSRERRCCDAWAAGKREAHTVWMDGHDLRALCGPVRIPWPGVKLKAAAAMLGRHPEALRHWLPAGARPGRSRAVRAHKAPRRYEEICEPGGVLSVCYEKSRRHGHHGVDVPVVWSSRPLNPGAVRGEPPHALWGTVWQQMQDCVPDDFGLMVERVPRYRPYPSRKGGGGTSTELRWRGWDWVCPGRVDGVTGERRVCGRRVQTIYMPLPVFTVGRWLGGGEGIDLAPGSEIGVGDEGESAKPQAAGGLKLSGLWYPGGDAGVIPGGGPGGGPPAEAGSPGAEGNGWDVGRGFACSDCWGVRNFSICGYRGWNDFVSYISGGLLYGKEVKQPEWFAYQRKQVQLKGRRGEEDQRDARGFEADAVRMEVKAATI